MLLVFKHYNGQDITCRFMKIKKNIYIPAMSSPKNWQLCLSAEVSQNTVISTEASKDVLLKLSEKQF